MRKENIGRLLLAIMTAFVMVIGVFGAAIYPTFTMKDGVEERSSVENSIAVDELEGRTGDIGEAPISANDEEHAITWTNGRTLGDAISEDQIAYDEGIEYLPESSEDIESPEIKDDTAHSTRAVSVEAYGPYGDKNTPYIEGMDVEFEADMIGASNDDYYFRWEVTGDKEFDVNHFPASEGGDEQIGEPDYKHPYCDNFIGNATVEAWDGFSMKVGPEGNMQNEQYYDGSYWLPVPRFYQDPPPNGRDGTWGLQFDVYKNCIVDQLGFFKTYAPNPVYTMRLWDMSTQQCIGVNYQLTPLPYYDWKWVSIKDPADPYGPNIQVNLDAGKSYIVSAHMYYSDGRYPKNDNPGPTSDGVMAPITNWFNTGGDSYPGIYERAGDVVLMDVHYLSFEPDVVSDEAMVWVDNDAPIVLDAHATITVGQEGTDVGFTGSFNDVGSCDEWKYRWCFGDGTCSDWKDVSKWIGGARILVLTSYYDFDYNEMASAIQSELGPFAVQVDTFDWGPVGLNRAPTWDEIKDYDVIVVGENYISTPAIRDDLGDVLADFSDAGKGVVTCWVSDMDDVYYGEGGVMGKWREDDYNIFVPGDLRFQSSSLGWFDSGSDIMQGVSSMSFYYEYFEPARSDATVVARDNYGYDMIAHKLNPAGSGGIIVGFAFMPASTGAGGDYGRCLANAVKWASQQPDPQPAQMPIQLPIEFHTYVDDHPEHVTPEDMFNVLLQVKDDDHERVVGGAAGIVVNELNTNVDRVELYNYGPDIDLTGWMLYNDEYPSQGLHTYTFPSFTLKQYHFVLLHENGNPANDDDDDLYMPGNIYWNNNGPSSCVSLVDTTGTCIDYVPWNGYENNPNPVVPIHPWTGHLQQPGDAIYRVTDLDTDDAADWLVGPNGDTTDKALNPGQTGQGPPIGDVYIMVGLGNGTCDVTIQNVFPAVIVPEDLQDQVNEKTTYSFEGITLTDPAIDELTESYWYRIDFGDGTPIGPWIYKGTCGKPSFKILLATTWSGIQGNVQTMLETELAEYAPTVDIYNWYSTGSPPELALMQEYDVVLVGTNYIPSSTLANAMGDRLYEYCQKGGNVVQMWSSFHTSARITGDWTANNYNPIERGSLHYGTESMGEVYNWDHPIMEGVTAMDAYYKHNSYDANVNAIRLADYTSGKVLAAYTNYDAHPNGNGRIAGLAFFPSSGYYGGDAIQMMVNAVKWAAGVTELNKPVLDTELHDYGDNGIYDVVYHVIDDDMWWDNFEDPNGQPVFTGPGAEEDWISYTHFPIEVLNVDPWIRPGIQARVAMDLVIRSTGEPKNDCTMTLWHGTTMLGQVTVYHDGNYKQETLPAVLNMGEINNYYVTVEYENADPDGANPTWVFRGVFPSGHMKELKKVFKEDGTIWTIGPDLLKLMIVGEEMVFTANGEDIGSDDLAFCWHYDDGEDDIHVYANKDFSMVIGEDQAPEDVFNAHPERDPAFIPGLNSIRSPEVNPIDITDDATHAFDEPGFYTVCLLLMDDDIGDGYPSFQYYMNGGGYDMEFYTVDLA